MQFYSYINTAAAAAAKTAKDNNEWQNGENLPNI